MATEYVKQLNNSLQSSHQDHLLSWSETPLGTAQNRQWMVACKVDGQVKGSATAPRKNTAKELAAKAALEAMGVNLE
ncbi:hypothetical protein FIBSPDRAFT_947349 [Athelia psychrophila]|uniref:DRBM domain-containing protein n=1 Tax=Athelia psychrophila TaxID=1759441 RepID=A0A166S2S7_9AGAM|nr:hypothetical protein FIBSPDRAFT_947349 [Fibularhizoctonia sp. CBS 109695]